MASLEKIEGETKKRDELALELATGSMEHSSKWNDTADQETIIGWKIVKHLSPTIRNIESNLKITSSL